MSSVREQLAGIRDPNIADLAIAVHDLKGHLAVISGQTKLLLAGKLGAVSPLQVKALADVASCCSMLENQIAGLLMHGLRKPDQRKPVLRADDLRQCLMHGYTSLHQEFHENFLQLEIDIADRPMIFPFDAHLVTGVLMNLLDNARRFTPPGGSVSISLRPHFWERRSTNLHWGFERRSRDHKGLPNAAKVVVADSGCGIASEFHQEIFEEFFSTPAPGCPVSSGLGLAIARNIVQAHGGKIWVESAVGNGSKFCFLLPWVASSGASSDAPFGISRESIESERALEEFETVSCGG